MGAGVGQGGRTHAGPAGESGLIGEAENERGGTRETIRKTQTNGQHCARRERRTGGWRGGRARGGRSIPESQERVDAGGRADQGCDRASVRIANGGAGPGRGGIDVSAVSGGGGGIERITKAPE